MAYLEGRMRLRAAEPQGPEGLWGFSLGSWEIVAMKMGVRPRGRDAG